MDENAPGGQIYLLAISNLSFVPRARVPTASFFASGSTGASGSRAPRLYLQNGWNMWSLASGPTGAKRSRAPRLYLQNAWNIKILWSHLVSLRLLDAVRCC